MLICDRCGGKHSVRETDVPISLADLRTPMLHEPMDLCTYCRDVFKATMKDFVGDLPRAAPSGV